MAANSKTITAVLLCSAALPLFAGCGGKQAAQSIEPPPSIISHQGNAAGFAPLDKSRAASAQTAINSDSDLAPLNLKVSVFNDTATLTGTVRTEEQKQKAEALARNVPGILKVEDKLQISP